jgi:hypothetical protein
MPIATYAEKLRFLIARRFPDYGQLQEKGLADPGVEALQQYETELANLSRSTLDEQYVQAIEERNREQEEAEERADRLEFFNQSDAAADFRFWCALEFWSLAEAAALLLGKDPRKVSPYRFNYVGRSSPFLRAFEDLMAKLTRAVTDGKLKKANRPSNIVDWAEHVGISVPEPLSANLETSGGITIEGRERASMLKLILGMAKKHYAYDAGAAKSPYQS